MNVSGQSMYSLGVLIKSPLIIVSMFDRNGKSIAYKEIHLPPPLMPGLATISVCELIDSIDKDKKAVFIGICLDGFIDQYSKVVTSLNDSDHWINVPLVDWIKARSERNVYLFTHKFCYSKTFSHSTAESLNKNNLSLILTASRLALEHSKNHLLSL